MCLRVSVCVLCRDVAVGEVIGLRFPQVNPRGSEMFKERHVVFFSCESKYTYVAIFKNPNQASLLVVSLTGNEAE